MGFEPTTLDFGGSLLLQGKIILNLFWCVYFLSAYNGDVGVSSFFPGLKTLKRNLLRKEKKRIVNVS